MGDSVRLSERVKESEDREAIKICEKFLKLLPWVQRHYTCFIAEKKKKAGRDELWYSW